MPHRCRFDARVGVRRRSASHCIAGAHRGAKLRQGVAPREGANQQRIRAQPGAEEAQICWQVLDHVQPGEADAEVEIASRRTGRIVSLVN
jgi:hypothetical protein